MLGVFVDSTSSSRLLKTGESNETTQRPVHAEHLNPVQTPSVSHTMALSVITLNFAQHDLPLARGRAPAAA